MISLDGVDVRRPHVTEIISPWADFSKIPESTLTLATERGSRVHAICAALARGEYIVSILPSDRGYVDSFKWWLDRAVEEVHLVEKSLVDEGMGFQGTLDLVVRLRGETLSTLVDLKTPAQLQKTWAAQLAAYRRLIDVNDLGIEIGRMGSLRLNKDGKVPKMNYYENDARDLAGFFSALQAHKYFTSGK